jgi:hypothetical protein
VWSNLGRDEPNRQAYPLQSSVNSRQLCSIGQHIFRTLKFNILPEDYVPENIICYNVGIAILSE